MVAYDEDNQLHIVCGDLGFVVPVNDTKDLYVELHECFVEICCRDEPFSEDFVRMKIHFDGKPGSLTRKDGTSTPVVPAR